MSGIFGINHKDADSFLTDRILTPYPNHAMNPTDPQS